MRNKHQAGGHFPKPTQVCSVCLTELPPDLLGPCDTCDRVVCADCWDFAVGACYDCSPNEPESAAAVQEDER